MGHNVIRFPRVSRLNSTVSLVDAPRYGLAEASFILEIPESTLSNWMYGRTYRAGGELRQSGPLFLAADVDDGRLSFTNLAEAHILQATRERNISPVAVRSALDYVQEHYPSEHPLVEYQFQTLGKTLLVERLGTLVNLSRKNMGQIELSEIIEKHLARLKRDETGRPIRLFPIKRNAGNSVMVDPAIASGQPVVADTGILAEVIHGRFEAGETPNEIAEDYGLPLNVISDTIGYYRRTA